MPRDAFAGLVLVLLGCGPRIGARVDAGDEGGRVRLTRLKTEVFGPSCGSGACHEGAPPAYSPMSLEAPVVFSNLVGVPATQAPSMLRVKPNDPAASYLVLKLKGLGQMAGGTSSRMPLGAPPLGDDVIGLVEQWISEGALDD